MKPPDAPDLTYRGLDWCDGCGAELAPEDRLSGLCVACELARSQEFPSE